MRESENASSASIGNGEIDKRWRDAYVVWLQREQQSEFIFRRMAELQGKINSEKFQMDVSLFDGFQISVYKKGGHYDWHTDTNPTPANGLFRKLSMVVMLSDANRYKGGQLALSTTGDNAKPAVFKLNKGDVITFYSHIPHKVMPVTKGERITLTTWLLGPKPR